MLKLKLPKNRIQYLIEEMEKQTDAPLLEGGWEFYHRGLVHNVELVHGYVLTADVKGKKALYRVSLDLERFSRSACTCSADGCCRHMAAVLFSAYAPHGRPELLLLQMRKAALARRKSGKAGGSKAEKPREPVPALAPEETPSLWLRYFEQQFYGYTLSSQHSIELFYQAVLDKLGNKAEGWPADLALLYDLHLTLFILKKIGSFHQENQSSYLSYYIENGCKIVAGYCWDRLHQIAARIHPDRGGEAGALPPASVPAHPRHWRETAAWAGEMAVRGRGGPVHWADVYRFLWWKVFTSAELRERERKRLELLNAQPQAFPRVKEALQLALSFFDLMSGDDELAMARTESIPGKQFADFYIAFDLLVERQQWDRLLVWLRRLLPLLAKAKQDDFHKGCTYWVEAMKRQPSDEEWIRVMLSLLPRSYYYYSEYLMQTGRYRQWVDLQLASGVSPANLYTAELKTVEAHDPKLLLPLYHQSVERAILEKNRDAYKLAIRQLKKLYGLYRQSGMTDRWSAYIERLSAKYARLRAFQEELAKGPWTT